MIFTIAPLVQEANSRRRWLITFGAFTGVLLLVLGVFGAAMAWAGAAVAAQVTAKPAREVISAAALTMVGLLALALALGELGLTRRLLPSGPMPALARTGGLASRTLGIALLFGAVMAVFSPLSTYALVLGWVAAQQSVWLGAATLMAYGLGLALPLALIGTLAVRRSRGLAAGLETFQDRARTMAGVSLALAGGFILAMWTLRPTWALFFGAR